MKRYTLLFLSLALLTIASCADKSKKENTNEEGTEINVSEPNIVSKDFSYTNDSITMKGYLAYDESSTAKRPGILVVHEWWGHNDYSRKRADMLAELGYTAMALDMYGDGKLAAHPEDAGKFSGMVMSNMPRAKSRFIAAMDELKKHPSVDSTQIAAIGYCFGGSVVLTMANAGMDLDAVAAFHSGVGLPIMPNSNLKARVLVCNGADDPFIAPESVVAFKAQMDSLKADYKYIAYEGAKHSFTSKEANANGEKFNLPLEYNEKADTASWKELSTMLSETFD
ncbi:MAG: dienelactone hydrolase family protein [Allomuricauda sp.]|nr:MAG: dienelactone hydrolase family protein [Allomuricauda sp.]